MLKKISCVDNWKESCFPFCFRKSWKQWDLSFQYNEFKRLIRSTNTKRNKQGHEENVIVFLVACKCILKKKIKIYLFMQYQPALKTKMPSYQEFCYFLAESSVSSYSHILLVVVERSNLQTALVPALGMQTYFQIVRWWERSWSGHR